MLADQTVTPLDIRDRTWRSVRRLEINSYQNHSNTTITSSVWII